MHWLKRESRLALRQLGKSPVFSITVILILAIAIGANTAVFTLVHAVMLKSLPVASPEQIFRVGDNEQCCVNGGLEGSWSLFSYDLYRELRDNTTGFQQLAAFQAGLENVGLRRIDSNAAAEVRVGQFVSGNFFQMFGVGAYAGHTFSSDDDQPEHPPVAVMSYRTWKEKYGADPSMIGSAVAINSQPFTLVGIAPPEFFGDGVRANPPEVWIPLSFEPYVHGGNSILPHADWQWLDIMGRVVPTARPKQLEGRMTSELRQWLLRPGSSLNETERKQLDQQVIRLTPGGGGVRLLRDNYEDNLKLLWWVTGSVLLIGCANLANLMLSRAASRRQEFSIRAALGASPAVLVRQMFVESLLLSILGGAVGLLFAIYGTRLILYLAFPYYFVPIDATPSWPVLGFAFVLALLSSVSFGVLPALLTARARPIDALRAANRSTAADHHWTQNSLVVLQAALSLVLICAAGLVVQSLRTMRHQRFGFETDGRYIARFDPQMAGYKPAQLDSLYLQIRQGLRQIPGIKTVSYAMYTPMSGNNWEGRVYVEGRQSTEDYGVFVRVGPDYFDSVGTRILHGRPLTDQDTATSQRVAVVNEQFVKMYFDGKNPVGRHFGSTDQKYLHSLEIVGVTENTNYWSPSTETKPMYFLAAQQAIKRDNPDDQVAEERSLYMNQIILVTTRPVPNLEAQVRRVMGAINPDLSVTDLSPFAQQVQGTMHWQVMIANLMSIFSVIALILATIGLYGVTSYGVQRRTSEIGIRMALGADRVQVVRNVMCAVLLQAIAGLVIGIPLTVIAGRLLASKLFGVHAFDLPVFSLAIAVLLTSAVVAGWLPARCAARIDPMQALRAD